MANKSKNKKPATKPTKKLIEQLEEVSAKKTPVNVLDYQEMEALIAMRIDRTISLLTRERALIANRASTKESVVTTCGNVVALLSDSLTIADSMG